MFHAATRVAGINTLHAATRSAGINTFQAATRVAEIYMFHAATRVAGLAWSLLCSVLFNSQILVCVYFLHIMQKVETTS